ncbi:hypothetical protein Tco_0218296 [Tanacetum coccineum]
MKDFQMSTVSYIAGFMGDYQLTSMDTKLNLMNHIGVKSWFHTIQEACDDFVSDERIVWVDIEGVPLKAWSRETFNRIGKIWRETLDLKKMRNSSFGQKRLLQRNCLHGILPFLEYKERDYCLMLSGHGLLTMNLTVPPNGMEPDDEFMSGR